MSQSQGFLRPPPSRPRGWNPPHLPPQPPSQYGMTMASHPGSANTWSWGSKPHHPPIISEYMHMYPQDAQTTQPTQPTSHPVSQTIRPGEFDFPLERPVDMTEYQRGLADGRLLATLDRLECEVLILRKSLERSSAESGQLAGRLPLAGLAAGMGLEDLSRRPTGTASRKPGPAEQTWAPAAPPRYTALSEQPPALYPSTASYTPAKDMQQPRPPELQSSVQTNNIYRPRYNTTSSSFAHTSQRPTATFQSRPQGYHEHLERVTDVVDRDGHGPTTTFSSRPTVRRSQGGRTGGRGRTHDLLREIQARSETIVLTLESDPDVRTEETRGMLLHLVPSIRESLTTFIERCMGAAEEGCLDWHQSVAESVVQPGGQEFRAIKSRMVERLSGLFKSSRGPSWKLTKNAMTPRVWSTLRSVTEFEHELLRRLQQPLPAPQINDEDDAFQATSTCINHETGSAHDESGSLHELSRSQTLCDAGWTPGKTCGPMVDEWIESEGEDDESEVDITDCHCEECSKISPMPGIGNPACPVRIGETLDTNAGGVGGADSTAEASKRCNNKSGNEAGCGVPNPWTASTWSWNGHEGNGRGDCINTVFHDTDREAGESQTIRKTPDGRISPGEESDSALLRASREIRKTRSEMSLVETASQVARPRSWSGAQASASVLAWRESCLSEM